MKKAELPKANWSPVSTRYRPIGQVSVIVPVYNNEVSIRKTFEALLRYLPDHPRYTFIFVNDGSCDRTKDILAASIHSVKSKQLQMLSYSPSVGVGYAIRRGVEYADGDTICYLNSALALDHLDRLVEHLQYCDVAIACRVANRRKLRLNPALARRIFHFLAHQILNLPYSDLQADLKGFRVEAAKRIFSAQTLIDHSFDAELLYLAQKWGYSVAEIPISGSAQPLRKASSTNLLQDVSRMLINLLKIRLNDRMGLYR